MRQLFVSAAVLLGACSGVIGPGGEGGGSSGGGAAMGGGSGGAAGGAAGGGSGGAAGGTAGGVGGGTAGAAGGGTAGGTGGGTGGSGGCPYKLCEGFESADAGTLPAGWTQLNGFGPGTVNVQTDSAHSGAKALKSTTSSAGQPRAQHSLTSLGAATQGTHWGRVFYRVGTPAPNAANTSNYFHITFVGLRATDESRVVDTVESPQAKIQYLYNLPDDSCCNGSAYNYTYDGNWHCAEWYVNNTTDAYRFFIDGAELTSIGFTAKTNARLADFTSIALGSIFYVGSNGALSAWLDDLAINDTQIGCQ